jgi:hypothetical protein
MKMKTILMAIIAGLAVQAVAVGQDNNSPSATANAPNAPKPTLQQRITKYYLQPKTTQTDKIERVGSISSRPWAQTAASYSAAGPSLFAGDRERFHDVQFSLFTFGGKPD